MHVMLNALLLYFVLLNRRFTI